VLRRLWICAAVGSALLAGCGPSGTSSWDLPERSAPAVRAEEDRISRLAAARDFPAEATCQTRLLGGTAPVSFAWVFCEGAQGGGLSGPVRVDGDVVEQPGDGSHYAADVRVMFPSALAELILSEPGVDFGP
jgi:hypothetical protein